MIKVKAEFSNCYLNAEGNLGLCPSNTPIHTCSMSPSTCLLEHLHLSAGKSLTLSSKYWYYR